MNLVDYTFIWDLDGTLLNSYPAITSSLKETYKKFDLEFDKDFIENYIIEKSVKELFDQVSLESGIPFDQLKGYFTEINNQKNDMIELMDGAKEILEYLSKEGASQIVYTHKGDNAHELLADFDLADYFEEIITSDNNFKRKPHQEAVDYLLDKYAFDKDKTYYVGDRLLDYELAVNSGIKSINLLIEEDLVNHKIDHLLDIKEII